MKLLISAFSCDPTHGSESGNGWNWSYYNVLAGNEVWCITSSDNKKNVEDFIAKKNIQGINMIYVSVPKLVDYLYCYQSGVYFKYLYWQYAATKIAKVLDQIKKFDLVHHVTWGSLQLGSGMWQLKKPMVFGPAGGGQLAPSNFKAYFLEEWKVEEKRKKISQVLLKISPYALKTIKKANVFLTSNLDTFQLAKKLGSKNTIMFLDTGLPESFFPDELPKRDSGKKLRILWIGRIFARKGLSLLLEALGYVDSSIDFELTILGDGPMKPYLPSWISKNKLENKVKCLGRVPWEEVKKALEEHDIFMFSSLRESFGSQLLEAMAYGLPIITLNHQGARDFVPNNAGIKVKVTSPKETAIGLAKAVEQLAKDYKLRGNLGAQGFSFAKGHTWPKKVEKINEIYKTVL